MSNLFTRDSAPLSLHTAKSGSSSHLWRLVRALRDVALAAQADDTATQHGHDDVGVSDSARSCWELGPADLNEGLRDVVLDSVFSFARYTPRRCRHRAPIVIATGPPAPESERST
jgi:hypothetical protein